MDEVSHDVQMATSFALANFQDTDIQATSTTTLLWRFNPSSWYLYMAGSSHFMVPFPKFGPCFMIQTLRYFATMMKPWYFIFIFPRKMMKANLISFCCHHWSFLVKVKSLLSVAFANSYMSMFRKEEDAIFSGEKCLDNNEEVPNKIYPHFSCYQAA